MGCASKVNLRKLSRRGKKEKMIFKCIVKIIFYKLQSFDITRTDTLALNLEFVINYSRTSSVVT